MDPGQRAQKIRNLGKPPVSLLAFGIGSFIVAVLAVFLAVSLIIKGGAQNITAGIIGMIAVACLVFLGVMSMIVWRYLRRH